MTQRSRVVLHALAIGVGLAGVGACSGAPGTEAQPAEATATATSALDPSGVITPTNYSVTVSRVYVSRSQEPFNDGVQSDQSSSEPWTPDTGYVDWAEVGAQVTNANGVPYVGPSMASCVLGPGGAGANLGTCGGGAINNGPFTQNGSLTTQFTVNAATDTAKIAFALDNIESTNAATVASGMSSVLTDIATGVKVAGTIIGVVAGGPIGAVLGYVSTALTVISPLYSSESDSAAVAAMETTCAGGLVANIPSGSTVAPDTVTLTLTPQQLESLTASGPGTITFDTSFWPAGIGGCVDGCPQEYCIYQTAVTLTFQRNWGTGLASSARSADFGVVRSPTDVEAVFVPWTTCSTGSPAAECGAGGIEPTWSTIEQESLNGSTWSHLSTLDGALNPSVENVVTLADNPILVSRDLNSLDMFWADAAGALQYGRQASPGYPWVLQTLVAPTTLRIPLGRFSESVTLPTNVPPHAQVTAVAQTPLDLDAFYVGTDGNVYSYYEYPGVSFTRSQITTSGDGQPGGGIASVASTPSNIDLFFVGKDGALRHAPWTAAQGWSEQTISSAGLAPAGAEVAATSRAAGVVDAFVVGTDGGLWTSHWSPPSTPFYVTTEVPGTAGTGFVGGSLGAVSRQPTLNDVVYQANGRSLGAGQGNDYTIHQASWASGSWTTSEIPCSVWAMTGGVSLVAPSSWELRTFVRNGNGQILTADWVAQGQELWTPMTAIPQ